MMHTLRYENSETENAQRVLEDAPEEMKRISQLKHGKTEYFKPDHCIHTKVADRKHKHKIQASYGRVKRQKLTHSGQWLLSGKERREKGCGVGP